MGGFRAEPIPGSPLLIGEVPTRRSRPDDIVIPPFPFEYLNDHGSQPLLNGYTNYSLPGTASWWTHASFYKSLLGRVLIEGLLNPGVLTNDAWEMPENLSPRNRLVLPAITNTGVGETYIIESLVSGTFMRVRPYNGGTDFHSTHASWLHLEDVADWHDVGVGGEPSFLNGWVNFNPATFIPASFYQDAVGVVWLQGLIKSGTVGQPVFTLPTYLQPSQTLRFASVSSPAVAANFNIASSSIGAGVVAISGNNTFFAIHTCYVPEGVGSWQPVAWENSWVNYGGGGDYGDTRYWKDPLGMVHIQGLMVNGVLGQPAFTLPSGYRPRRTIMIPQACFSNTVNRMDISKEGHVMPMAGSNVYFSACVSFLAEQ